MGAAESPEKCLIPSEFFCLPEAFYFSFSASESRAVFPKDIRNWASGVFPLALSPSMHPAFIFHGRLIQRIELLNRIAGSIQFASRLLPFATLFLCVTTAIAVYDVFRERSARQLLLFGCTFFLVWSAGTYFSNFANTAETYVSWENQLDPVCESDALYLVTDDGAYFSMRKMKEREPVFTSSENVSLKHVSRNGSFASFSYEKSETENAWVSVPFNYYPQYHALDENGEELPTSLDKELLRLRVQLPEKEAGTVNISFQTPGLYRAGDFFSLSRSRRAYRPCISVPERAPKGELIFYGYQL